MEKETVVNMDEALKLWRGSKNSFKFTCPKCGSHSVIIKKNDSDMYKPSKLSLMFSSGNANTSPFMKIPLKRDFKLYCQKCKNFAIVSF